MGNLCSGEQRQQFDVFEYRYGEDDREIKIQHDDTIDCQVESVRYNLEDAMKRLRESEKRFYDVTIGADPLKLVTEGKEVHCHFERPEQFLRRDGDYKNKIYRIFNQDNCRPSNIVVRDDVLQYFGVFLCYLADHSELIETIILTGPNSYGLASIYMVHDGRRRPIYIDDYILCNETGPIFSQPVKDTDMWPCLLEKAWFKYKSSLKSSIDKINPIELFRTFLMFPMKPVYLDGTKQYNHKLVTKHLVQPFLNHPNGGTIVTSKMVPEHKIGLSGRKHYYLMRIFDIDGTTYYYLRNPCGNFDFRGNLQLKDIPQQLLDRIIKLTGEYPPAGNFLLTQQQFEEQIQTFFVVKYSPEAPIVSELEIPFAKYEHEEVFIKFEISRDQPVGMRLHQMHKVRGYDPVTYLLIDADRKNIVAGLHNQQACFAVEDSNLLHAEHQRFMPGRYILRIKRFAGRKEDNKNKFILETMLASDVLITNASENIKFHLSEGSEFKKDFHDLLKEIGRRELNNGGIRDADTEHVVMWMGDIVVLYIRKIPGGKDAGNLEVYFPDLTNLHCITHDIGKNYTPVSPFQNELLIIFEKKSLVEETKLDKYSLTPY